MAKTRKSKKEKKREAIQKEFNRLFNERRLRYDDVLSELEEMFFISQRTIERYLKG